ncbi:MAG TPA: hypothetical protein VNU03_07010 [Methylomirabilota bacterium]|nr:hypothetical protein [Methylomirabilota bacterium]
MIAAAIAVLVFVLYIATYASIPAGDGYWVLNNVDRVDLELLFNPPSLLTQLGFLGLRRLADLLGLQIATLTIIQTVNAMAAGVGAALLYGIVRTLGGSRLLGGLTAGLLAVSFGYWYFADGEAQLLSLVVLLAIVWLITRARARGDWTWRFVAGVALLNSLAGLLRQENVIFGFAAVAFLAVGRPWRRALSDALVYAAAGSLGTWTAVLFIGLGWAPGVHTVADAVRWYLWVFRVHVGAVQDFQGFEHATKFDVPRLVKGQMTAFIAGTQAVVDSMRDRALLGRAYVLGLIALTVAAYAMMVTLAVELRRLRRLVETRLAAMAVASAVWIVAYKALVHGWLWPTVTKYQVVTVPPLIILCVLGVIAAQKAGDGARARRLTGLVAALVALVFVVDLSGGILPWRHYGQMKAALEVRRSRDFRAEDLFISSESGIDPIFARLYQGGDAHHVGVKDVFVQKPTREAFASIRAAIDGQLALGRRVFVYNLVPGPYSLVGMNQAPTRAGVPLGARDFEIFFDELRATYALRPVFSYWEESKAPLYLFGERQEPFFEVGARS